MTDIPAALDPVIGFSIGSNYATTKLHDEEIKQGKNYYLASFTYAGQVGLLATLIQKINETLPPHPYKRTITILCNVVPLASFPSALFCAAVKQGDYASLADSFNQSDYAYIKLPEKLGRYSVGFFSFFADHAGKLIHVAMFASAVAIIALGKHAYGGGIFAALAYQAIDQWGFIPRRISLFMEIYMPVISVVGIIAGGTWVMRAFNILTLGTYLSPEFTLLLHQKVDQVIRYFFSTNGPSLKEIHAPVIERKEMTYDEIMDILDHEYDIHYNINPAHCSKPLADLDKLPRDQNFDKFILLFDSIDWQSKYSTVKKKLTDDDRFIDFLLSNFPDVPREEIQKNSDDYIQKLADIVGKSPEEYAVGWMRDQLEQLVSVLLGNKRIKGMQQDLDEAIDICQMLLPHLLSLPDQIELEDALLKLSIEGGDYCGRGLKRAVNELLWGMIQNLTKTDDDPVRCYELKMLQALQTFRYEQMLSAYESIAEELGIPVKVSDDVHGWDLYRTFFSLGCYPLTPYELRRLTLMEICVWQMYGNYREQFYSRYKWHLEEIVREVGEAEFGVYFAKMIDANTKLTDDEKQKIIEKFTECNEGNWTVEETLQKVHLLMLVKLGVVVRNFIPQDFKPHFITIKDDEDEVDDPLFASAVAASLEAKVEEDEEQISAAIDASLEANGTEEEKQLISPTVDASLETSVVEDEEKSISPTADASLETSVVDG